MSGEDVMPRYYCVLPGCPGEHASKHQFCEASAPAGDLAEVRSLLDVAVTSVCTGFDLPDDWLQKAAAAVGRPIGKDFKPTPKREAPCRWTQMDQGGSTYNTCAGGESFSVEPGCEPWPHCHWCGKRVVLVPWEEWGNDDDES